MSQFEFHYYTRPGQPTVDEERYFTYPLFGGRHYIQISKVQPDYELIRAEGENGIYLDDAEVVVPLDSLEKWYQRPSKEHLLSIVLQVPHVTVEDLHTHGVDEEVILNALFGISGNGICACGSPDEVIDVFKEALDHLRVWSEDRKATQTDVPTRGHWNLVAYILDARGFSDHGSSVYGAWITPRGTMMLAWLEEFLEEKENGN